jgi:hypothetical protein
MNDIEITIPILIIGFNRPHIINKTFDCIRNAKPQKLYIAIDGPRQWKEEESDLVNKVKEIVSQVNWTCDVKYKFSDENKGAEITVSSAISWVLSEEKYVIVIEDDIIAPFAFLRFAQEMLIKYQHESQITIVSGCNFTPIGTPNKEDYFFAKYGHSWGWATWKRAWEGFDLNLEIKEEHLQLEFLKSITNSNKEAKYYQRVFTQMKNNGVGNNTWDYISLYRNRINNKLSIIPRVNLTSNIGVYGLHADGKTKHHFRPFDEAFVVKQHPQQILCWNKYDIYHFKHYINNIAPLYKRIIRKSNKIAKNIIQQYVKN